MPSLDYTVTVVKAPFLYEWCRESLLDRRDETDDADIPEGFKLFYQPMDAGPWGAESAYRLTAQDSGPMNWYLLCYSGALVELRPDWELTQQQMAVVAEKLSVFS